MRKSMVILMLVATAGLGASSRYMGGWAVVTVDDLPDYVVAGQPTKLSFVVRQHGMTPLDGLNAAVEARLGSETFTVKTAQSVGERSGRYLTTLNLPRAGDWTVTIQSGFGGRATTLPLRAVQPGAAPGALSDVERGRRLFIAKGCFTCHVNSEVTNAPSISVGPELTGRRYPALYLAKFLADPDRNPMTQLPRTGWVKMPKLGLTEREIASLVAMINSGGRAVSAR